MSHESEDLKDLFSESSEVIAPLDTVNGNDYSEDDFTLPSLEATDVKLEQNNELDELNSNEISKE